MTRLFALVPEHEGDFTAVEPQKSDVVPQNPYLEQQTFNGHFSVVDHCAPHPGSHSDLAWQLEVQFPVPQNVGPNPQ